MENITKEMFAAGFNFSHNERVVEKLHLLLTSDGFSKLKKTVDKINIIVKEIGLGEEQAKDVLLKIDGINNNIKENNNPQEEKSKENKTEEK